MNFRHVLDPGASPRLGAGVCALLVALAATAAPQAQTPSVAVQPAQAPASTARVLTLDEALALAEPKSEQVAIAAAGIERAQSDELRARSEWLPQLGASAAYSRALASEFEGLFENTGPGCIPFSPDPLAGVNERLTEIERALQDCPPSADVFGSGGSGGDGGNGEDLSLPFGRANTYSLNLAFSQNIYAGGRLAAQRDRARIGRQSAILGLTSTRAQLALDVARAYYDAVLSDRLVVIAEAALQQAEATAEQVRQQREVGRLAEFDLVRAQVTRDSQRPELIRRRNARNIAHLRLKQLIDVPLETELRLVADLEAAALPMPTEKYATAIAAVEAGAGEARERSAVVQADHDVAQREQDVRIARSQRLPAVSVTSTYGRVAYPGGVPGWGDFRTNWSVGASAQVPIFTGGRIKADEISARATLTESKARAQLARELSTLDAATARLDLVAARAAWEATAGTVQQAQRGYEIAELRYREGLSTQLELSDSRLLLQQAQATRAEAARAVQLARVRLALLPDLPLSDTGAITPTLQESGAQTIAPAGPAQGSAAPAAASGTAVTPGGGGTRQQ